MEFVETISLNATLLGLQYNYKAEFTRSHVTKFSPRTLSSTALFGGHIYSPQSLTYLFALQMTFPTEGAICKNSKLRGLFSSDETIKMNWHSLHTPIHLIYHNKQQAVRLQNTGIALRMTGELLDGSPLQVCSLLAILASQSILFFYFLCLWIISMVRHSSISSLLSSSMKYHIFISHRRKERQGNLCIACLLLINPFLDIII